MLHSGILKKNRSAATKNISTLVIWTLFGNCASSLCYNFPEEQQRRNIFVSKVGGKWTNVSDRKFLLVNFLPYAYM